MRSLHCEKRDVRHLSLYSLTSRSEAISPLVSKNKKMSKKKTIFDLYRKNDANFSETPSSDAWAKLERKLDGETAVEPRSGRFIRMNFMSIAAGLMLVVGAAAFLMLGSNSEKSMAMNEMPTGFFVEDLVLTDSDVDFQEEIRVANDYRARFAGGYIPAEKDISEAIADATAKIQPRRLNQKPSEMIAFNDEVAEEKISEEVSDRIQKDLMEEVTMADVAVAEDFESANSEALEIIPAHSNAGLSYDSKSAKKRNSTVRNTINQFNWLVGDWEQQMSGMKSIERWVADSANTISGAGYLVQGDDTIFTERPTIKQIDDKIYFFQNIDASNSRVPYELMVETDTQWIFENKLNLPTQVILTKGKRNYEFEMLEVPPANAAYLKNRNLMIEHSAKRNMARVN